MSLNVLPRKFGDAMSVGERETKTSSLECLARLICYPKKFFLIHIAYTIRTMHSMVNLVRKNGETIC